jgi:HEPN domain-containing protein
MLNRWKKLLKEAEWHLERAEAARAAAKPVWAYYAAHQSAETAVKALRLKHSLNGHERMVARLLLDMPDHVVVPNELIEKAAIIDSHYLPVNLEESARQTPRINGKVTSEHAVQTAQEILSFVKSQLNGSSNGRD